MLNNVTLQGRICKDLELKTSQNGTEILNFTLAVERNFAKQGEKREADFINCIAFKNNATHISRYFQKGSMLIISGSIQTRSWDNAEGKKQYATEVIVNNTYFCESKKDGSTSNEPNENLSADSLEQQGFKPVDVDEDLPF